jgi:polyisoprenoid-binding protein YceI
MRRAFRLVFGALVIVVVAAAGFVAWYVFADRAPAKPTLSANAPVSSAGPATPDGTWHVEQHATRYVGYRIKELFGDAVLKHVVVARTPAVTGTLTIAKGRVETAVVTADVSRLASDREARDSYIRDNGLQSNTFPTARFTLTVPIALPAHLGRGQHVHVEATGTMLLHGVTSPVTFTLDARWNGPTIDVVGTAPIVLRTFGIVAPDTVIAKVDSHGSIEVDLSFAPG